jgi:hypothetical protein
MRLARLPQSTEVSLSAELSLLNSTPGNDGLNFIWSVRSDRYLSCALQYPVCPLARRESG